MDKKQLHRWLQLSGIKPLREAFEDEDFKSLINPDDDDDETNDGRDFGSDKLRVTNHDEQEDVPEDPEDNDDEFEGPGDKARRLQGPGGAHKAAQAIAALRQKPSDSVPEIGDNVDHEETVPGEDETPDVLASDQDTSSDPSTPETVPDLAEPVIKPPMGGSETTTSTMERGQRVAKARDFIQKYPNATRKEFMTYCAGLGVGKNYANILYYAVKKKMAEYWVVVNPASHKVLAEGSTYDIPIWTDFHKESIFNPGIMSEYQAKKASEHLSKNGFPSFVKKFSIGNEQPALIRKTYESLIGKRVRFQSKLSEHYGVLNKVANNTAYFTDDAGKKWSTSIKNLKG